MDSPILLLLSDWIHQTDSDRKFLSHVKSNRHTNESGTIKNKRFTQVQFNFPELKRVNVINSFSESLAKLLLINS